MKKFLVVLFVLLFSFVLTTVAIAADTDPVTASVIRRQISAHYGDVIAKIEAEFEPALPPVPEELLANDRSEYDFVDIKREVSTFDLGIFDSEFTGYPGRIAMLYTDNNRKSADVVWCFVDVSPCASGAHGSYVIERFYEPGRGKTRSFVLQFTPSGEGKELPEADTNSNE